MTEIIVRPPPAVEVIAASDDTDNVIVQMVGARGPQGPPGPAGGTAYEYVQSTPAASWIINHNLNRPVHVTLYNDSGEIVYSDVQRGSSNTLTVSFPAPTTGSAVVS